MLVIQFPESQGASSLVYSVQDNLEGAVFTLTSFMLYGDGHTMMEMKPINRRTGAWTSNLRWRRGIWSLKTIAE